MERFNETERGASAPKRSNVCSLTGTTFQPGDKVYSILFEDSGGIKRLDLCADAWKSGELPRKILARWTSRVRTESELARREKLAPNDALVALFDALAAKPDKEALRYALALLLTRRRVFRLETDEREDGSRDLLCLYSPRSESTRYARVVPMSRAQIDAVQTELLALLDAPVAALEKEGGSLDSIETYEVDEPCDLSELERAAEAASRAFDSE